MSRTVGGTLQRTFPDQRTGEDNVSFPQDPLPWLKTSKPTLFFSKKNLRASIMYSCSFPATFFSFFSAPLSFFPMISSHIKALLETLSELLGARYSLDSLAIPSGRLGDLEAGVGFFTCAIHQYTVFKEQKSGDTPSGTSKSEATEDTLCLELCIQKFFDFVTRFSENHIGLTFIRSSYVTSTVPLEHLPWWGWHRNSLDMFRIVALSLLPVERWRAMVVKPTPTSFTHSLSVPWHAENLTGHGSRILLNVLTGQICIYIYIYILWVVNTAYDEIYLTRIFFSRKEKFEGLKVVPPVVTNQNTKKTILMASGLAIRCHMFLLSCHKKQLRAKSLCDSSLISAQRTTLRLPSTSNPDHFFHLFGDNARCYFSWAISQEHQPQAEWKKIQNCQLMPITLNRTWRWF